MPQRISHGPLQLIRLGIRMSCQLATQVLVSFVEIVEVGPLCWLLFFAVGISLLFSIFPGVPEFPKLFSFFLDVVLLQRMIFLLFGDTLLFGTEDLLELVCWVFATFSLKFIGRRCLKWAICHPRVSQDLHKFAGTSEAVIRCEGSSTNILLIRWWAFLRRVMSWEGYSARFIFLYNS